MEKQGRGRPPQRARSQIGAELFQSFSFFAKLSAKYFQAFCQVFPRILLAVLRDINGLRVKIRRLSFFTAHHVRTQPQTPVRSRSFIVKLTTGTAFQKDLSHISAVGAGH
jgi:hypothetical protein